MHNMKNGGSKSLKKQAAVAIAMKKAGKKPKKMQDGGPVFKGSPKSDKKVLKKVKKFIKDPEPKYPLDSQKFSFEKEKFKEGLRKKMQAGGVVKSQPKRVGPVDPDGAWTKVQERNLPPVNAKTKVSLAPDKELGATKMMKKGGEVEKAKGGKWIQKAIKKPGALRAQLGAKKGEPIPAGKLAAAAKKGGKLGQRARLAMTLKKMKKK